jgi:hypothetical protein
LGSDYPFGHSLGLADDHRMIIQSSHRILQSLAMTTPHPYLARDAMTMLPALYASSSRFVCMGA